MSKERGATIVITGGAGFIGSNLAVNFAKDGYPIIIVDDFSRAGVTENWEWLQAQYGNLIQLEHHDIRTPELADRIVANAAAVFHFAAQVAVTQSLADPYLDFDVNLRGTLLWLDALRRNPSPVPFIFASTNKVYGTLADILLEKEDEGWVPCDRALRLNGVNEKRQLDFHTPYGCSKGSADQYVLDFGRHYHFPTTVLRMSCIYGPRQWGTEDQGWLAHFARAMMHGEPITLYGDGRQMRDILFIDDAVAAYRAAFENIARCAGQAFNLGGGPENAVSLLTAIEHLEGALGASAQIQFAPWRSGDQRWYVTDPTTIRHTLELPRPTPWREGLIHIAEWIRNDLSLQTKSEVQSCA